MVSSDHGYSRQRSALCSYTVRRTQYDRLSYSFLYRPTGILNSAASTTPEVKTQKFTFGGPGLTCI